MLSIFAMLFLPPGILDRCCRATLGHYDEELLTKRAARSQRFLLGRIQNAGASERSFILARTSEGRTRAKARGVRFGRKPALTAHQQAEARARRETGESLVDIARTYNVSHSTISRLAV